MVSTSRRHSRWSATKPRLNSWFPPGKRRFASEGTHALLSGIGKHPVGGLLYRAVEAYRRALGHWIPEEKLLAGEFLYISAEALSRFLVQSRSEQQGTSRKNLARLEGADDPESLRKKLLGEEVFAGDTEASQNLAEASNGFEHGYLALNEVRGLLDSVLQRSMSHVRRALIDAVDVPSDARAALLAQSFEEPRALSRAVQVVWGKLSLKDSEKGAPEMEGASVELDIPPTRVTREHRAASGDIYFQVPTEVTVAKLPDNLQITLKRAGLRAANVSRARHALASESE